MRTLAALAASVLALGVGIFVPAESEGREVALSIERGLAASPFGVFVADSNAKIQTEIRFPVYPVIGVLPVSIFVPIKINNISSKLSAESWLNSNRESRLISPRLRTNQIVADPTGYDIIDADNYRVIVTSIVKYREKFNPIIAFAYKNITERNARAMGGNVLEFLDFNLLLSDRKLPLRQLSSFLHFGDLSPGSPSEVFGGFREALRGSVESTRDDSQPHRRPDGAESRKNGGNAYANRPPLIRVVAAYILSMIGGALLGCFGALNLDRHRKRIGTALIAAGLGLGAWGSIAFVIGLGLP